ncbi:MAG: hypothetical protein B6I18_08755 [Bacteroidetes bacterium 4572_112]|nr:MAG: hypothetical protein B6I18_08755 [Bacteroidetes bacterium 4572_112]
MKTFLPLLALLFIAGTVYGQTIIKIQDFESSPATPTYTYSNTNGTTSSGNGVNPSDPMYSGGSQGHQFKSTAGDITFSSIDISSYANVALSFRVASFSDPSVNGADIDDYILVKISTDGGNSFSDEVKLKGRNNARWSFTSGTGIISLDYDGDNSVIEYGPSSGGDRTTDGYSTIKLTNLPLSNDFVVKIEFLNDHSDEIWVVDDVKIMEIGTSDIIKTTAWNEPTNIAYGSYSATSTLTTSNSLEIAGFTIRDGGGTNDADALSTKLTDLSIDIDNWENIKAIAVFNGSTNVAEITTLAATVSFSSLTLEAADNATKDFTIRATFNSTVTDNQNIKYTISAVTEDNAGSEFSSSNAGGATTDNTGDNNKIIVTATKLAFTTNKPPSSTPINTDFEVEVKATDANGNTDIDATNSITLAKASGTGILSSATGLSQSLSSGVYSWSDVKYDTEEDFTIEAQTASLTNKTSVTIACSNFKAWINEFHYDNDGKDANEMVEICILNASSYNSSDFTVTLYNGGDNKAYNTKTVDNFTAGTTYDNVSVYYYNYPVNGIQNETEGIALTYNDGTKAIQVVEFISYEGTLTAADGPANGVTSTDVGVSENNTSTSTTSIGRIGTNDEWSWESGNTSTAGTKNNKSDGEHQVLPINLISFSAIENNEIVNLGWQTATEENNDYFTIERSYDAKDFAEIVQIVGARNSNQILNYKYNDVNADLSQTIYYKLKQTDYDGKYTYSNIISVNSKSNVFEMLESYSNNGVMNISINSNTNSTTSIELYDITGSLIYSNKLSIDKGINTFKVDVSNYSMGIYLLRISNEYKTLNTKLFID